MCVKARMLTWNNEHNTVVLIVTGNIRLWRGRAEEIKMQIQTDNEIPVHERELVLMLAERRKC